jgi:hypothetical protein
MGVSSVPVVDQVSQAVQLERGPERDHAAVRIDLRPLPACDVGPQGKKWLLLPAAEIGGDAAALRRDAQSRGNPPP